MNRLTDDELRVWQTHAETQGGLILDNDAALALIAEVRRLRAAIWETVRVARADRFWESGADSLAAQIDRLAVTAKGGPTP